MNAPLFFGSAGDERGTPQDFFDTLHAEFQFEIDCAASPLNHKCDLYFGDGGVETDALAADWGGSVCFLNPPYSVAGAFVAKAREEANKGATVVMVLPVRSDTKWWHRHVWNKDWCRRHLVGESNAVGDWRPGVECRFVPGRLNFELRTTPELRTWITERFAGVSDKDDYAMLLADVIDASGLPKMAIERMLDGQPDDCLMDAAPFPSCVVIFTKETE